MKSAKAFAPGNISCVFVIKKGKSPAKSGSLGLGFTVNKGIFATIKRINNKNQRFSSIKSNSYFLYNEN